MISKLHFITHDKPDISHDEMTEKICAGGVDWVQLRLKNKTPEEWFAKALETQIFCKNYGAKLIMNDNVALAKQIGADGVHLGKTDMDAKEARKILGSNFIIGGTANAFEDIQKLHKAGVDYIGLGPFRFTTTKSNLSPVLGLHGYEIIIEQCLKANIQIPVIAIGGIKAGDVPLLMKTGIYGIAVASALTEKTNFKEAINAFKAGLYQNEKVFGINV